MHLDRYIGKMVFFRTRDKRWTEALSAAKRIREEEVPYVGHAHKVSQPEALDVIDNGFSPFRKIHGKRVAAGCRFIHYSTAAAPVVMANSISSNECQSPRL